MSDQLHAPAALHPGKNLSALLIGGWMGSTAGLDVLEKRKISWPCRDSYPGLSSQSLITTLTAHQLRFTYQISQVPVTN